jgi:hypothetical protein
MAKEYTDPGPIAFRAVIQRNEAVNNSSAYVAFPYDLKETYGVGNLVPFKATFDGTVVYRGSLAKMGGPQAMILLRADVRAKLRKRPGDEVDVVVELDDKPRQLVVPGDILQALRQAGQLDYFTSLAYTHRKEYVKWVEEAKRDETRWRRIQKMCEMLTDGKKGR